MSDTTISRRYALKTGGLAALGAGLLGSTGTTTPASAEPAPQPDLIAMLCARSMPETDAEFAAGLGEWTEERTARLGEYQRIREALYASVPADLRQVVNNLSDAQSDLQLMASARE